MNEQKWVRQARWTYRSGHTTYWRYLPDVRLLSQLSYALSCVFFCHCIRVLMKPIASSSTEMAIDVQACVMSWVSFPIIVCFLEASVYLTKKTGEGLRMEHDLLMCVTFPPPLFPLHSSIPSKPSLNILSIMFRISKQKNVGGVTSLF